MPIDLLIYIVVAVVLVIWLRNTLGSKNGAEIDKSEIIDQLLERQKNQQNQNFSLLSLPNNSVSDATINPLDGVDIEGGEETTQEIMDLMRIDSNFNPKAFINGAREAFPMIVESFAKGDLKTLKMLLSDGVYAAFERAIEDRKTKGEILITDVHAIKDCKILGVKKIDKTAYIKLRFVASETIVSRDREGSVISGHPDKIIMMNDVWTFGRVMASKDPTWYLYETSDDVVDDIKNPIPDAQ